MANSLKYFLSKDRLIPNLVFYHTTYFEVKYTKAALQEYVYIPDLMNLKDTWIPLQLLSIYAKHYSKILSPVESYSFIFVRSYKSVDKNICNNFDNAGNNFSKCMIDNKFYYIGKGCILDSNKKTLLQIMVKTDYCESTRLHSVVDTKVLIDCKVLNEKNAVYNYIRNKLLPAFAENNYTIEIRDLSDVNYISKPIVPKRLNTVNEDLYGILNNNVSLIKKFFKQ